MEYFITTNHITISKQELQYNNSIRKYDSQCCKRLRKKKVFFSVHLMSIDMRVHINIKGELPKKNISMPANTYIGQLVRIIQISVSIEKECIQEYTHFVLLCHAFQALYRCQSKNNNQID